MAVSITDRLTAAIRIAEQSIAQAVYQSDYRNWHEVHRVLQDARDELGKVQLPPMQITPDNINRADSLAQVVKLDGRTKEARALKASQ
jgi:hypothetical protein